MNLLYKFGTKIKRKITGIPIKHKITGIPIKRKITGIPIKRKITGIPIKRKITRNENIKSAIYDAKIKNRYKKTSWGT